MTYDKGIMYAIDNYIRYGFPPGSCAMEMVFGDLTMALINAHFNIKKNNIAENTFDIINTELPEICLGESNYYIWIKHGGLENISKQIRTEFEYDIKALHIAKKLKGELSFYKFETFLEEGEI